MCTHCNRRVAIPTRELEKKSLFFTFLATNLPSISDPHMEILNLFSFLHLLKL